MPDGPNLFTRLHKWATRQDENFVTESLAVVLEHLLVQAPEVGTRIIKNLTGGLIDILPDDAGSIEIRTQVKTGQGRPDLEIRVPHRLVWVEVKVESALRAGQLEGYRVLLAKARVAETGLVLLTRYPQKFAAEDSRPDRIIRWYHVADSVEMALPALAAAGGATVFLARQFLEFVRARRMTLTQVDKYLTDGLRALGSLINIVTEAASACQIPVKRISAGTDTFGLYLDGGKYWVGFYYAAPGTLWFCTCCEIDRDAATKLGGEVTEESWASGRHVWWHGAELESEAVHFFARSKVGQMEWLESFLGESLASAQSIETPDQPPIPDESEED